MSNLEEIMWSYLHGDLEEKAFVALLHVMPDLEEELGRKDYLSLISLEFGDDRDSRGLKREEVVRDIVSRRFRRQCECIALGKPRSYRHGPPS